MISTVCAPQNCALCMACVNICPVGAINISEDENGFEVVQINQEICIGCNRCTAVCNRRKDVLRHNPIMSYAAQAKEHGSLKKSASGGAFQMLAEIVLANGGVCYGAAFEKDDKIFRARHVRVACIDELPNILNTKYVPSIVGDTFREALADLNLGKLVLFSGLPCQIQGLKAYIGKDYDNLLTVDVICHGIASSRLFNDYVKQMEADNDVEVLQYSFRDKSVSWGTNYCYRYCKKTDEQKRVRMKHCPREASSYTVFYLNGEILRENCYSCSLAGTSRVSDFTFGDFWEIEREYPEFITKTKPRIVLKKGVSCILANTSKAKVYVQQLKDKMIMHEVLLESIVRHNENLKRPTHRGKRREELLRLYREQGYGALEQRYHKTVGRKKWMYRIKNALKSYLPDWVRICIYRSALLRRIVFR